MSSLPSSFPCKYHEARLSFDMQHWQTEKELHGDKYFQIRTKLLNILCQEHTPCCHFCGFPDGKFLEIHHLDGDHENWDLDNLIPCCSLCHRMHHLGWVGLHNLGRLVYIPVTSFTDHKGECVSNHRVNLLPHINLYQHFYLLNDQRTHAQNEQLNQLPLSGLFSTARNLVTSFGFDKVLKEEYEYGVLKDALNEDRRKVASFGDSPAQNDQKEASITDEDAPKHQRGSLEHIPTSQDLTEYEEELKRKGEMSTAAYVTHTLHLLDFVEGMVAAQQDFEELKEREPNTKSPLELFHEKQREGNEGVCVIEFNPLVLHPWDKRLGYTHKERMAYYLDLGLFHANPASPDDKTPTLQDLMFRCMPNEHDEMGFLPFSYCTDKLAELKRAAQVSQRQQMTQAEGDL